MADATKLSITSEVVSAGTTEKVTTTFTSMNPALTDVQLGEFADSIGTILLHEPDYYTRVDSTVLQPGADVASPNSARVIARGGILSVN